MRVTELAKGNVTALFFLLTNLTGFLSAFLDNVTCVLLIGPVTIKLCEQIGVDPVPFYLTETIAATIGGTATLIGDPPNVVIGNKIGIGFNDFLVFNGPLVLIIMPLATIVQYYRFRHHFKGVKVVLDMETLKSENKIHDEKALLFCGIMFCGIFLALFLSPIHGKEAAWFCLLGMLGAAVTISTHDIRRLLHHVEWDTILFFAALFVFVESLAELGEPCPAMTCPRILLAFRLIVRALPTPCAGLIRFVGRQLSSAIANVGIESRLVRAPCACACPLFVRDCRLRSSRAGQACLCSRPAVHLVPRRAERRARSLHLGLGARLRLPRVAAVHDDHHVHPRRYDQRQQPRHSDHAARLGALRWRVRRRHRLDHGLERKPCLPRRL